MWGLNFFQVAPENSKICVQLSIFKTDQAFPDTLLPGICGIFPQNSHLCGREVFSCLKNTHSDTLLDFYSFLCSGLLFSRSETFLKRAVINQKRSRISAQAVVTLPSLGLVLPPARGPGSSSAPGRALGWGRLEAGVGGVGDCGLHVGLEGLGTKDRCGLSSREPGENVLWSAASQPCKIKKNL